MRPVSAIDSQQDHRSQVQSRLVKQLPDVFGSKQFFARFASMSPNCFAGRLAELAAEVHRLFGDSVFVAPFERSFNARNFVAHAYEVECFRTISLELSKDLRRQCIYQSVSMHHLGESTPRPLMLQICPLSDFAGFARCFLCVEKCVQCSANGDGLRWYGNQALGHDGIVLP